MTRAVPAAALAALALAVPAGAAPLNPRHSAVRAELIAEHASAPPGGRTRVGVHFDLDDGWHIYADPPGDAGLPTTVKWSAPAPVRFGPLSWPTPEEFLDPGDIRTRGYAGTVVLSSVAEVSRRLRAGLTVPIHARVTWLACKDVCVPGSAELDLALPVSEGPQAFSTHAQLFEHVR